MLPVFYWVLPSFTGFYRVLPSFTRLYWVSLSFTGFYRVLPSFAEFLMGSTGFYWVLLGCTGFWMVWTGLEWAGTGFLSASVWKPETRRGGGSGTTESSSSDSASVCPVRSWNFSSRSSASSGSRPPPFCVFHFALDLIFLGAFFFVI